MSEPDDRDGEPDDGGGRTRPRTVRVPLRSAPDPFSRPEYAEVPEDTAAHWSDVVWHDRPPR